MRTLRHFCPQNISGLRFAGNFGNERFVVSGVSNKGFLSEKNSNFFDHKGPPVCQTDMFIKKSF